MSALTFVHNKQVIHRYRAQYQLYELQVYTRVLKLILNVLLAKPGEGAIRVRAAGKGMVFKPFGLV